MQLRIIQPHFYFLAVDFFACLLDVEDLVSPTLLPRLQEFKCDVGAGLHKGQFAKCFDCVGAWRPEL